MFEKFIESHPNFKIVAKPTSDELVKYSPLLPAELIQFWEQYGFGTFMDGYLKIVNPAQFQGILHEYYLPFMEPATVFGVTAFGDLLVWEREWVKQVNLRRGKGENQGSRITSFFNTILAKWDNAGPELDAEQFRPALERLGECAFDECYGYFPALALGGSEKVENLQKVKLREHISMLSQMVGVIQ